MSWSWSTGQNWFVCGDRWWSNDRARLRDFFDVAALLDRYGHDRLLELAAAKDRGFTPETFVDALRAITRLSATDWAEDGVNPDAIEEMRATFVAWRNNIEGE